MSSRSCCRSNNHVSALPPAGRDSSAPQGPALSASGPAGATDAEVARKKRWRRIKWTVRIAAVLFVIGYLRFVGLDGKFYYPNDEDYGQPAEFGLTCEDVSFQTSDGLILHGWFLPASQKATGSEPDSLADTDDAAELGACPPLRRPTAKGLVVHFHGNAANVTAHLSLVAWLPKAGYHVLMFDYRGFGKSQGHVTRAGTIRDGHAALDYALSRPEAKDLPLFFYGQSLGGAVAIVVAAERHEVRAVVAESTFSTYRGIAARHAQRLVHIRWLANLLATCTISAGFDPLDAVPRLAPRPLFVIAAEDDDICFPKLARELYDAAAEPKFYWLVPEAEHLGIVLAAGRELTNRVCRFFEDACRHRD